MSNSIQGQTGITVEKHFDGIDRRDIYELNRLGVYVNIIFPSDIEMPPDSNNPQPLCENCNLWSLQKFYLEFASHGEVSPKVGHEFNHFKLCRDCIESLDLLLPKIRKLATAKRVKDL